jgi:DNA-binding NarL/FixJ family response regulator
MTALTAMQALARQENRALTQRTGHKKGWGNPAGGLKKSPAVAARRERVAEMLDQGLGQSEIAKQLGVTKSTAGDDIAHVRGNR